MIKSSIVFIDIDILKRKTSDKNMYIVKFLNLLGHLGLEPRTIRLKAGYSTIELMTLSTYFTIQNNFKFDDKIPLRKRKIFDTLIMCILFIERLSSSVG